MKNSHPFDAERAEHCKDCCCARSWEALGVTDYTGKSIPEHIQQLREKVQTLVDAISSVLPEGYATSQDLTTDEETLKDALAKEGK